ncbi:MAG: ADP-glyceromanno-heptose 6-epimerase [Simkaniaceae bacterium]|nr:ADP-glyceromanno-heptose 6-epimerase [Simkaniaceae bacterium]
MKKQMFDDQLIVVTGAAGFIGSGVVRHLNDKGFSNLLLVDDFGRSDKWKNLVGKKYVDFISRYDLMQWLEGKESQVEAFIHLGACSSTTETDGDYITDINYRYSINLCEYAMKNNHRFIYASSAATYGSGAQGYSDDHGKIDSLSPMNVYGYSKQMFDQWLLRSGLIDKVVGLKYFNIFGPNEYHKGRMASMVLHMVNQINDIGKVRLFKSNDAKNFKDGDQCRDFLYVKDAVAFTCSFLENDLGGIYNAGSGKTTTWNQLAEMVFAAMDKKPTIEYFDMPEDLAKQYQNFTCADMKKSPSLKTTPMDQAVADYVKNYLLRDARW